MSLYIYQEPQCGSYRNDMETKWQNRDLSLRHDTKNSLPVSFGAMKIVNNYVPFLLTFNTDEA